MDRERSLLIVLYVAIAASSMGLFAATDTDLTIYIAGAILGIALTAIAIQLRGGLDR